jgi:hypothetical protein
MVVRGMITMISVFVPDPLMGAVVVLLKMVMIIMTVLQGMLHYTDVFHLHLHQLVVVQIQVLVTIIQMLQLMMVIVIIHLNVRMVVMHTIVMVIQYDLIVGVLIVVCMSGRHVVVMQQSAPTIFVWILLHHMVVILFWKMESQ